MTAEIDTQRGAVSAADVAELAARLQRLLDATPGHSAFVRPLTRRTVTQIYRSLCAYAALLQLQEDK